MKIHAVLLTAGLLVSSANAITPALDGVLDEWWGAPDVTDLGSQPGIGGSGAYTLLTSWDADSLYFAVSRDSTDRYLGDVYLDNDSFFIAIDVDGVPGSGATLSGYQRVRFGGSLLPDLIYCYISGDGWYDRCVWLDANWYWPGWTNVGACYGWQQENPDDELAIPLADIGGDHNVTIWAWMTRENDTEVKASWPAGATGQLPTMYDGLSAPEPAALLSFTLLALLARRR